MCVREHLVYASMAIAMLIALTAFTAISDDAFGMETTNWASEVKNPDTFVWDTIGDPQTLDPAECYDDVSSSIIYNVYDRLVTYKGSDSKTVYPSLATDWSVDSSGKIWTFHLRKGVKFSNGDPFNAEAVKYSFDRVLIMNSPSTGVSWILSQFMYTYDPYTGEWNSPDGESSVRVVDNYTVEFHLREPYSGFLATLAFTVSSIVDPKVVEEHGGVVPNQDNEWMSQNMVGTGPYKLVVWKRYEYIKLEWNPNYWGSWEGKHVKYVIRKNVPVLDERETHLENGDADMAYVPFNYIKDLEGKEGIVIDAGLSYNLEFMTINCRPTYHDENNPLHNKLVRQAISYAVDYQRIIDEVYMGYVIQSQGPIPKGMLGHDDNLFMYHHDPQKARELLEEAGYGDGFSLTILYNQGNDLRGHIAEIVKENLGEIGISVNIEELAWPTLLDKMYRGDYGMIITGWAPDYNDPDDYVHPFLGSASIGGDVFRTGWQNDTVDDLIIKAKYEVNQTKRVEYYKEVQEIAMDDPSFVYLVQMKHIDVYRSWLQGYQYNPSMNCPIFYELYKNYIPPLRIVSYSPANETINDRSPTISFEFEDKEYTEYITIFLSIDGFVWVNRSEVNGYEGTVEIKLPFLLTNGKHYVAMTISDDLGNEARANWSFTVDAVEIEDLKGQIEEIQSNINGLKNEIAELEKEMEDLQEEIGDLQGNLSKLEERLNELEEALDENISALNEAIVQGDANLVERINENVTSLREEIENLKSDIDSELSNVQEKNNNQEKNIEGTRNVGYVAMCLGVIAIILAIIALITAIKRKDGKKSQEE